MTGALANHLWQSTVFVVAAWLLTLLLRDNSATIRFRIWFAASLKFLVPFSLLMSLGHRWDAAAVKSATPQPVSVTVAQLSQPFTDIDFGLPAVSTTTGFNWLGWVLCTVWLCGFTVIAVMRIRDWRRIQGALRTSAPLDIVGGVEVRSSEGVMEPGVVGWLRPVLLLPAGIEQHLTSAELQAVLAHEMFHVQRRDNLTSAIHMIVESVFWFHPIVWWIGASLVEERERACDEEVLKVTGDSKTYADAILAVCKRYVESPLGCVPGVSGSNLKKRIEAIMMDTNILRLNLARKVAIGAAGLAALGLPVLIGVMQKTVSAQSGERPRFASVTIRPSNCEETDSPAPRGGTKTKKKRSGEEPGTLRLRCAALGGEAGLIRMAYVNFANGEPNVRIPSPEVSGGPDWLDSEYFDIEARAEGDPSGDMMMGPMMQVLLEERMKLQLRRESVETDAYALTASAGTPRLQPFQEGSCVPRDFSRSLFLNQNEGVKHCSFFVGVSKAAGPWPTAEVKGASLNDFAKVLSWAVGRPVINATGIAGRYDFHLEFAIDENTPKLLPMKAALGEGINRGQQTILTAIQQQYGLKLVPARALQERLLVERIERPKAD